MLLPVTLCNAGPLSSDILSLEVTEHGPDARVITVMGEIDVLSAPDLAAVLTAQLLVAPVVVVDLDGVRFLGSYGLSALFEVNELARREGRELRLVCNSQVASWAMNATGLRDHFTFVDTVSDALTSSP
jgi:anti-sigma B factor antagonist